MGVVKERRDDHRQHYVADKERLKAPVALQCSGQIEFWEVPDSPYKANDHTGPERCEMTLQKWLGDASPTELLNRSEEQHDGECGEHRPHAFRRHWGKQRTTLDKRARSEDKGQALGHRP